MCVGNIWAVCAHCPTKHADFTLGFLRFPDSSADRLRQPGARLRAVSWPCAGSAAPLAHAARRARERGFVGGSGGCNVASRKRQLETACRNTSFAFLLSRVSIFHEFCSSFKTEIARELLLPFCLPAWLRGCPAGLGRGVPRGTVPPCWAAPAPTLVLLPGAGG